MMITTSFTSAAFEQMSLERRIFMQASDELFEKLGFLCAATDSLDSIEPQIRAAYRRFLFDMNYPQAAKNFEALLKEKSGDKFYRDDGSVNWFHEFIPTLTFIQLARMGKDKGGFDFEALEIHGGLETFLNTHKRHDSVEDNTTQRKLINELDRMNKAILEVYKIDPYILDAQSRQMLINIHFMTQKPAKLLPKRLEDGSTRYYAERHDGELIAVDEYSKIYHRPDADYAKQDVVLYTGDMVYHPDSNPLIFIGKQLDTAHNFATMFSPKFTPDRRLKRCNEREDMFGSRYGFPEAAAKRWPEFAEAIKTMDAHLGTFLYHHFGLLQNVDRYHKNPYNFPNGFSKYMPDMFRLEMPSPLLDMRQMLVRNTLRSVDPDKDPVRYERLQKYMERRFIPGLSDYKDRFPDLRAYESRPLFPQSQPAPVAF